MKKILSSLILGLFTLSLAACGAPSPEELCKKAEEKDQKECTEGLTKIKETLGDDLWKEFSKCAKDKDMKSKTEVMTCLNGDMIKKIAEAAEKK